MAIQVSNPFYSSNSTTPGGTPPPTGSPQRLALDNLIRRELRVGDPNDSQQIAQALLTRYKGDPRALAIAQEARGLPFLHTEPVEPRGTQAPTSSDAELQQARDDVERDLRELTTNNLLKDITPELEGWGTAVHSAITEGSAAARFSLDPRQRDKAFAIRRQLGDYARLARLVGTLTPTLSPTYRKFAQSLDEVAAVLMVLMGEALSTVGFSGGRFLLQVPYSELQTRRDAAIYALRNLVGATQEAYSPNDWPRGLDAYRNLFRLLEVQGQGDLRTLLVETELARAMDELIQRAAHGRAEGLRALGATAKLDLQRFHRLVAVSQRALSPESPPLAAFLEALKLFADAFDTGGGFRLLRIARPPILFYGLYGIGGLTSAERALVDLVMLRGLLAEQLDCYLQCGCSEQHVACQVMLDKILYDVDRAIDLYAVGVDEFSEPERRAAAYSFVIHTVLTTAEISPCLAALPEVGTLRAFVNTAWPEAVGLPAALQPFMAGVVDIVAFIVEIQRQFAADPAAQARAAQARATLPTLGLLPRVVHTTLTRIADILQPDLLASAPEVGTLRAFVNTAWPAWAVGLPAALQPFMAGAVDIVAFIVEIQRQFAADPAAQARAAQARVTPPESLETTLEMIRQELCIQRDAEARWENLVRSMAPNCLGLDEVFNQMASVLNAALAQTGGTCEPFEVNLPPHFETSLDSIADDVDRLGRGRPTLFTLRRTP